MFKQRALTDPVGRDCEFADTQRPWAVSRLAAALAAQGSVAVNWREIPSWSFKLPGLGDAVVGLDKPTTGNVFREKTITLPFGKLMVSETISG